jgi:IclR family pca regulon transcriptional regulator
MTKLSVVSNTSRKSAPSKPAKKEDAPESHFVQGLAKGLQVIQAFNNTSRAMTLTEVASSTGLSRAAARRMLMTLEDLGFAAKRDKRHFVLTPRVLSLGYAYLSSMPLWAFAEPILEVLVRDVQETCSLVMLDDTDVVYVVRIPIHRTLNQGITVGSRVPAHCNSHGRVLLAGLNAAQLGSYFERASFERFTDRTIVDPARLADALEQTRQRGYAWASGEMQHHLSGLSVPVLDADNKVIAALNVSITQPDASETAFVKSTLPKLRRAAERLHTSLVIGRNQRHTVLADRNSPETE